MVRKVRMSGHERHTRRTVGWRERICLTFSAFEEVNSGFRAVPDAGQPPTMGGEQRFNEVFDLAEHVDRRSGVSGGVPLPFQVSKMRCINTRSCLDTVARTRWPASVLPRSGGWSKRMAARETVASLKAQPGQLYRTEGPSIFFY